MQQPVYQNPNTPTPDKAYNQNIILWAAMLVSQFLLLLLLYFTKPESFNFFRENDVTESLPPGMTLPLLDIILGIFGILALLTFTFSFILKARFLRLAARDKKVGLVQSGYILAYALCEATSLFGFFMTVTSYSNYFLPLFALGFLGLLLHFPRRSAFQAAAFTGINLND